jgi:hypothetical protein
MSNLQLTEFVKRPGAGTAGRATRVRSNFFEVQSFPEGNIHHYDITITPDVPPVINRKIWKTFEDQDGQGALNKIRPVYDGRKNIFSPKALTLEGDAGMFEVRHWHISLASTPRFVSFQKYSHCFGNAFYGPTLSMVPQNTQDLITDTSIFAYRLPYLKMMPELLPPSALLVFSSSRSRRLVKLSWKSFVVFSLAKEPAPVVVLQVNFHSFARFSLSIVQSW